MFRLLKNKIFGVAPGNPVAESVASTAPDDIPGDINPEYKALIREVRPFTMTSVERLAALAYAVDYLIEQDIPGDFVECGVWRGGSMMLVAYLLAKRGVTNRNLFLYDTFEGMPPPSGDDVCCDGRAASDHLALNSRDEDNHVWAYAPLDGVRRNLERTGYPMELVRFVKGKVEDTLAVEAHARIALLRLDTDWYESTKHEFQILYPQLVSRGVLIIDDYGFWAGARKATDEYLGSLQSKPLLARIDNTGRIAVKP